jgi:CheY-like chemotaxis protein
MRILVVEDERKIARFVQKGLREFGFAVDVIGRGDEALEMILDNPLEAVGGGLHPNDCGERLTITNLANSFKPFAEPSYRIGDST